MRVTGQALLEELGYEVLLAQNGEEAVKIVRENGDSIDLVILDMIMPKMNGRDCFLALKALRPGISIILSSGFTRKEDVADMRKLGLAGFIQKPFKSVALSKIVSETLHAKREESE